MSDARRAVRPRAAMCPPPSPAGPLALELPATPTSVTTARHALAEFCAGHALDHEAVALAVSEAVANAVVHAYRGRAEGFVRVSASFDDGALAVVVSDDGPGMMPRMDSPGMGIGLALIASLTSSLEVDQGSDGTRLTMRFAREG